MYTCTLHKYCIIVLTCTCTRSCKISDYQHLGLTRRSTQLAARQKYRHTAQCPWINPNHLGCVQNRIQIGGFGTVRVNTIRKGLSSRYLGDTMWNNLRMVHTSCKVIIYTINMQRTIRSSLNVFNFWKSWKQIPCYFMLYLRLQEVWFSLDLEKEKKKGTDQYVSYQNHNHT